MFWSTVLNRSLPALWCEIWCLQVSHNYEQGQQLLQSREFSTRRRQKPTAVFRFFWGISWRIFQEFMGFSWDFQANVRVWPWDGWFFLDFVKIHYSKMLLKTCYFKWGSDIPFLDMMNWLEIFALVQKPSTWTWLKSTPWYLGGWYTIFCCFNPPPFWHHKLAIGWVTNCRA